MKKKITYEQPLNDHIRYLLRLAHLFEGIQYWLKGPTAWDSRAAIELINELLEMLNKIDLKDELIHDLDHHIRGLERWRSLPKVDNERLDQLQQHAQTIRAQLTQFDPRYPEQIAQYSLLASIRQRSNIIGGSARSDLPSYHFWLNHPPKQRVDELNGWLAPLEALREAIAFTLYMVRNNAVSVQGKAMAGFFQSSLDVSQGEYQLIQVLLPIDHDCYPEINGGKQRFTIRFYEQPDTKERALQTEQDVNFELCCCLL